MANRKHKIRPWVNNAPLSIVKMIDEFIQENDKDSQH